jgi:RHS repeat-associated protein
LGKSSGIEKASGQSVPIAAESHFRRAVCRWNWKSVASALVALPAMVAALFATADAWGQPSIGATPNMLNAIALPVPYDQAIASLAAQPVPQTAAPVIAIGGALADVIGGTQSLSANAALGCTPPAAPAELVELARALKYSPDLIYEYVYDNIETLPQYGSLKGPLGTLLDGMGTAFDQAELMYVLLQQSCYAPQYEIGQIQLTATQYQSWLGTDTTWNSLGYVVGTGGIPVGTIWGSTDNVTAVTVGWAWVKVPINGSSYVFDPATKSYNRATGLANPAGAMGYSQSTFLSQAESGAKLNATSLADIASLNRTNLRNSLASYATNLVSYIRTNSPAAATMDIVGGKTIVALPLNTQLRQSALPYAYGTPTDSATMPPQYRTTMAVSVPGASPITFNSSDIYGHRLSLFFNAGNRPVLRLDGVIQVTGSAVATNSSVGIGITVTHPYSQTFANQSGTLSVLSNGSSANASYVISNGWGQVGRGMIEKHRKLLQQNQAAQSNSSDETVLGESLAMIGYTWLAQNARVQQLTDRFAGTSTIYQHAVGIVGMKVVGTSQGPFVDLPMNFLGVIQRVGRPSGNAATPVESAAFFTDAGISSVLESGTIEQTQPGAIAVSTVKLLDIVSQSGKIFDINNNAIAGDNAAYYNSTIRPQLTGYNANDLARIDSLVSQGMRVIAAKNGSTTVNQWTGTGYFQLSQDGSSIGAIITGGLSGGEPASAVPPVQLNANTSISVTPSISVSAPIIPGVSSASPTVAGTGGDPVNRVSGDYVYRHDDLSIGSGSFPYGLSFTRFYNSGERLQSSVLGLGWTHNFAIAAASDSDGFEGMAATSPINGAAAIVAIYVTQDILNTVTSNAKPLDRIALAAEIERWLMDQLTGNVVAVTQPELSERFTKLPDGSYNAPLGSSASLTLAAGAYTYLTKNQVALAFNAAGQAAAGQLATWHDPSGPTVTFTYTGSTLTSVSNGMGRTLTFTYTSGRISNVADGTGRSVNYTYDASNNLTVMQDPASKSTTFAYDLPGRMTKIFYPTNPTIAFVTNTYDSLGRVSVQSDANGNVTNLFFAGSRTEIDDPAGTPQTFYFTPRARVLAEIDGFGFQTVNSYDGLDRVTQTTLPEGNGVAYTYDAKHNVLTATANPKPGSGLSPTTQVFTYDPTYNKVHTATDALQNTTTFIYDPTNGTLREIDQPAVNGQVPKQTFTYNGRGQVLTATDPTGKVTQYTYHSTKEVMLTRVDDFGRLNLSQSFGYDSVGNLNSVTDPNNNQTATIYDAMRRVQQVTAPASLGVVKYVYDPDGHVLTTTVDPGTSPHLNLATQTTWTPSFKKFTETDPSSNKTTYSYDALDRLQTTTDAAQRVTTYGYDVLSRLNTVTNAAIQATPLVSRTYTANGQLYTLTDANGHVTIYSYDGFDRLSTVTYADGSTETYGYDLNGNVLTRKTRSGNTIGFTYDPLNRIGTKTPQAELAVTYVYDLAGRLGSVSDISGSFIYGYDTAGRNNSVTRPDSKVVSYQYDAAGNRIRLTWPDTYFVTYVYDALNRMTDVKESGTTLLAHYGYDLASRRNALAYGNGASVAYGYFANSDLQTLTQSFVGSSIAFTHDYNGVHQRKSVTVSDASFLYRPPTAASVSYTPNLINAYSNVAGASFAYDGNANLTSDGAFTYVYDTENRLLSATRGGHVNTYAYDALGRRAQKNVDGVVTNYLSEGSREIAEYDGSGSLVTRTVYGPSIDEPVASVSAAGKFYYHQDALGSVIATTNGSGALSASYSYGAYGESANVIAGGPRYTGRRFDPETGLYYYRARYYSPTLGRFLQTDPIGYQGGINLYAYVGNDALNSTDPSGNVVYVGGHVAFPAYGGLGGGDLLPGTPNHLTIVLVPNNPSDFQGQALFNGPNNGYATLGAQPSYKGPGLFGYMESRPNNPDESIDKLNFMVLVPAPPGMTDTQHINALVAASKNYGNDLQYGPYPDGTTTFNSNSYVSGVLKAGGSTPPSLPAYAPGYQTPSPIPTNTGGASGSWGGGATGTWGK